MRNYLCIDIGGTAIKYGKFNREGENLNSIHTLPTVTNTLLEDIFRIVKQYEKEIVGVAISSAGIVNPDTGEIIYAGYTMPGYTGTNWKALISEKFGLSCEIENDVNCACLGESWQGVAQGYKEVVCLTVGTGIGGSILINGDLHHGHDYSAGEIGYIPIKGNYFQDIASTTALVQRINSKRLEKTPLSGQDIFRLAKNGDALCQTEIYKQMTYLMEGIATVSYLLNPEIIVLGGGIMSQEEYLTPIIQKLYYDKMVSSRFTKTKICFAKNGNNANLLGALRNFLKK